MNVKAGHEIKANYQNGTLTVTSTKGRPMTHPQISPRQVGVEGFDQDLAARPTVEGPINLAKKKKTEYSTHSLIAGYSASLYNINGA